MLTGQNKFDKLFYILLLLYLLYWPGFGNYTK